MNTNQTQLKKYHRDIFLPSKFKNLPETRLTFGQKSYHAIKAANSDRYGRFYIPNTITFSGDDIIEAELESTTNGQKALKLVIRLEDKEDKDYHVCYAVMFVDNYPILKTVWRNYKYDDHDTLDESQYYAPFSF